MDRTLLPALHTQAAQWVVQSVKMLIEATMSCGRPMLAHSKFAFTQPKQLAIVTPLKVKAFLLSVSVYPWETQRWPWVCWYGTFTLFRTKCDVSAASTCCFYSPICSFFVCFFVAGLRTNVYLTIKGRLSTTATLNTLQNDLQHRPVSVPASCGNHGLLLITGSASSQGHRHFFFF